MARLPMPAIIRQPAFSAATPMPPCISVKTRSTITIVELGLTHVLPISLSVRTECRSMNMSSGLAIRIPLKNNVSLMPKVPNSATRRDSSKMANTRVWLPDAGSSCWMNLLKFEKNVCHKRGTINLAQTNHRFPPRWRRTSKCSGRSQSHSLQPGTSLGRERSRHSGIARSPRPYSSRHRPAHSGHLQLDSAQRLDPLHAPTPACPSGNDPSLPFLDREIAPELLGAA